MIIMKDMELTVWFVKDGWIMMKFKDSKLCFKLLNNYQVIDKLSPEVKLTDFLDLDYYYAYTKTYKKLKDGYYPNKIFLVGYKNDEPFCIVFKKIRE